MKKVLYMLIIILGNAVGTALMSETNLGMTAWGSAASNIANLINLSFGQAFFILSALVYLSATLIRGKFILKELIESTIFTIAYASLSDFFIYLVPDLSGLDYWMLIIINVFGMLFLMFAIAVHIRVNRFVHPMDVFLLVIQKKLGSIATGTYISFGLGFVIAVVFGLFAGGITDIDVGTIITLLSSGLVMKYYGKWILDKWSF